LKTIWVFNRGVEHLRPFQDERCELRKTLVGKRRPRERMPLEVLREPKFSQSHETFEFRRRLAGISLALAA
jgi:hypothetical protein